MSRFGFAMNNLKKRCCATCSDVAMLFSRYAHSRRIYNKCAPNSISFDFNRDLLPRRSQIPFFKALSVVTFSGNSCSSSLFCFFLYRDFRSHSEQEIVYVLFSEVFSKFHRKLNITRVFSPCLRIDTLY